jgi:nucleoside-diphosphate-sugar epimerase
MKTLITGIKGFLGSAIARELVREGHAVSGTSSRDADETFSSGPEVSKLKLGEEAPRKLFDGVACVIHCAHDFSSDAFERNVKGTKQIFLAAKSAGVPGQVFISSYSATPRSKTRYGQAKFTLETFFLKNGGTVLKPGLVLGAGGLGGRLLKTMRNSWIFPMPGGSAVTFPYVGINDFVRLVIEVALSGQAGTYNVFYPDFTSFSMLAAAVKRTVGRPFLIVPLPIDAIYPIYRVVESLLFKFGARLPVNAESLISLRDNQLVANEGTSTILSRSKTTLQEIVSSVIQELDREGIGNAH